MKLFANNTTVNKRCFSPLKKLTVQGTLLHCWWECKLVQSLWKQPWSCSKKLKLELPYDPAILLLVIYPKNTIIWKDTCTPMFTAALFTITKAWKQATCPLTGEWIKKMCCIYTMEYYSAIRKNKIMPFAAKWMDPEVILLSEINQKEKDKYHRTSFIWES